MLKNRFVMPAGKGFIDAVALSRQSSTGSAHKPMHALNYICLWGRGDQMEAIAYKHKAVNEKFVLVRCFGEPFTEDSPN
jgi:hypothetical protein